MSTYQPGHITAQSPCLYGVNKAFDRGITRMAVRTWVCNEWNVSVDGNQPSWKRMEKGL